MNQNDFNLYIQRKKEANTILVEGIKDGNPDLKVLPPLLCIMNIMNIPVKLEKFYMETKINITFMYLMCRMGAYYGGYTNDLNRRLHEHNNGKGAKYTRGRRPVELLHYVNV